MGQGRMRGRLGRRIHGPIDREFLAASQAGARVWVVVDDARVLCAR